MRIEGSRLPPDKLDHSGRIALTFLLLALILLLSYAGIRPPAPKPTSIPSQGFSAERAREVLNRLVGDGVPHPTGSAHNEIVRGRVMDEFTHIGYDPQIQTGFACDEYGDCATVKNVIARLDGNAPGPAVLLAAHYDSVPAGPGASDDGAGAATVLEIARAYKSLPTPKNSLIFLIDDGEEAGLLGARVFVEHHPWAKDVRAVVNVDNRGTSGPSLMFETGEANAWATRLYTRHASHPATNSIFYFAYKNLPADTDFTIFKAAGYEGVNFAAIGDAVQYHTLLDNFRNANSSSLQHQGDNALSSVAAFAAAEISDPPKRAAVYFDLFEHWTVSWPVRVSMQIALSSAFLLFVEIVWLIYKKILTIHGWLWGCVSWLITLLTAGIAAWALQFALRKLGAEPVDWVAHSLPLQIAFWSLAVTIVCYFGARFVPRSGAIGLWAGVWSCWAILGILLAARAPSVSYIFQVGTVTASLAALAFVFRASDSMRGFGAASILPLAAIGIVGFGTTLLLYPGFGNPILPVASILLAFMLTPMAPLCADLRQVQGVSRIAVPGLAIAVTLGAAFLAVVVPAFSAKSPEHVNFEYVQDSDSGKSRWVMYPASGRLPEPIRLATNAIRQNGGPFPWVPEISFATNAPHLDLPPPTFTILESSETPGKRRYRTLLRSERGASRASVLFPADSDVESVQMEGQPLPPESERLRKWLNGWYAYSCETISAKGIEISFTLPAGKPVQVYAVDTSFALPLEGMFLLKSRPFTATPYGDGDQTVVVRHVELLP
jgi:peptidase M28-like protein